MSDDNYMKRYEISQSEQVRPFNFISTTAVPLVAFLAIKLTLEYILWNFMAPVIEDFWPKSAPAFAAPLLLFSLTIISAPFLFNWIYLNSPPSQKVSYSILAEKILPGFVLYFGIILLFQFISFFLIYAILLLILAIFISPLLFPVTGILKPVCKFLTKILICVPAYFFGKFPFSVLMQHYYYQLSIHSIVIYSNLSAFFLFQSKNAIYFSFEHYVLLNITIYYSYFIFRRLQAIHMEPLQESDQNIIQKDQSKAVGSKGVQQDDHSKAPHYVTINGKRIDMSQMQAKKRKIPSVSIKEVIRDIQKVSFTNLKAQNILIIGFLALSLLLCHLLKVTDKFLGSHALLIKGYIFIFGTSFYYANLSALAYRWVEETVTKNYNQEMSYFALFPKIIRHTFTLFIYFGILITADLLITSWKIKLIFLIGYAVLPFYHLLFPAKQNQKGTFFYTVENTETGSSLSNRIKLSFFSFFFSCLFLIFCSDSIVSMLKGFYGRSFLPGGFLWCCSVLIFLGQIITFFPPVYRIHSYNKVNHL